MIFSSNVSSDWINSKPIFYNSKTLKASHNILDVIDYETFQWNPDGLEAYCEFGYSVFGQTPIENVNFLLPNQKIQKGIGAFKILETNEDDIIFSSLQDETTSDNCIELLKHKLVNLDEIEKQITLPLSGGFDSRLLLNFFPTKEKLSAYTYGISSPQQESFEVKNAKILANKFNINWKWVELGEYNKYINDADSIFGPSSHAHGMYHHEFYKKIRELGDSSHCLLSGLIGDAWAGSITIGPIKSPKELILLSHSHGMKADPFFLRSRSEKNRLYEFFWEREKFKLQDPKWRIISSMRSKMMLLRYLIEVPLHYNYKTYAPFIHQDMALSMLNLPDKLRFQRRWQKDFLASIELLDLNPEVANYGNSLNTQALRIFPVKPLEIRLLREIFEPRYIEWINNNLLIDFSSQMRERAHFLSKKIPINRISSYFSCKDVHLKAYFAYLTLYPLQKIIEKRNLVVK